ncbi:MAG: hypothetical protein D6732_15300 [Methanobacteriota archaeon]|nr:MAG: hypothetical protein D6732_15300 [Euryarchaeota archaeon]
MTSEKSSKTKKSFFRRKEKDPDQEKRKLEWDPSDGLQWQDFAGLIIGIFLFFWKLLKLILSPFFWAIDENVKMWRFARQSDTERPMKEEERLFFESIPIIFVITGLSGGVMLGIFVAFSLRGILEDFINNLNLEAFFASIVTVIKFFYEAIVWIISGIGSIFTSIFNFVVSLFSQDPFVAFSGLLGITILFVLLVIVLREKEVFARIQAIFVKLFETIIGSPDRFRLKMSNFYRRANHAVTVFLIGAERLEKRKLQYFKNVAFYTLFTSFLAYIEGIVVAFKFTDGFEDRALIIGYFAFFLLLSGIGSGLFVFFLVARFIDALSRKKYIVKETETEKPNPEKPESE